ncbi:MAG: M24 family metallopeptidase [Gemmatimonadaceae bacterium]|nr:M24 family metallopeptidase [Gemmatimonadaceae bacterium]
MSAPLSAAWLAEVQDALRAMGADGWLLYDFRGTNAVAMRLLGFRGLVTRRIFAWIPATGTPVAITHAIEQDVWHAWPASWERRVYSAWRTLDAALAPLLRGRTVAMEWSPMDAVPVVDRVPAGVVEMVRGHGATVVSSADLISRFVAGWSADERRAHVVAAETIAALAREAMQRIGAAARTASPLTEHEVAEWLRDGFARAGLATDHGPIVAATEHAASPHYEPSAAHARAIVEGDVVLIDLFAMARGGMWADQTWMGVVGVPTARQRLVWETIRDARDAAIAFLADGVAAGRIVRGAEVDAAARAVVARAGFGDAFTHRLGHSIDARGLHGAGPNLDDLETRDDRALIAGVGFSIEPGVYLPGEFGMRTEVNAYLEDARTVVVTPREIQRELFRL